MAIPTLLAGGYTRRRGVRSDDRPGGELRDESPTATAKPARADAATDGARPNGQATVAAAAANASTTTTTAAAIAAAAAAITTTTAYFTTAITTIAYGATATAPTATAFGPLEAFGPHHSGHPGGLSGRR